MSATAGHPSTETGSALDTEVHPGRGPRARVVVLRTAGRSSAVWTAGVVATLRAEGAMAIELDEVMARRRMVDTTPAASCDVVLSPVWSPEAAALAHRHRALLAMVSTTAVEAGLLQRVRMASPVTQTVLEAVSTPGDVHVPVFQDLRAAGPVEVEVEPSGSGRMVPHGLEVTVPADEGPIEVRTLPERELLEADLSAMAVEAGPDTVVSVDGVVRPELSRACTLRRSPVALSTVTVGSARVRF